MKAYTMVIYYVTTAAHMTLVWLVITVPGYLGTRLAGSHGSRRRLAVEQISRRADGLQRLQIKQKIIRNVHIKH